MGMASTWAVEMALLNCFHIRMADELLQMSFIHSLSLEPIYRDQLIQQTLDGLDHSGEQACEFVRQALQEMQDSQ